MTTKLFSIALLFSIFLGYSQTTPIPDGAFESALIATGVDTNGLTGDILNSDAAAATFLFVGSSSISDLTGIEAFVNLQTLFCENNSLSSLNLSTLSALQNLDCSSNTIGSLDFSNNPQLLTVSANNNFGLSSIDVTQNPLLTDLTMQFAALTSLDVTNNPALRNLNINYTFVSDPDLTNNIALEQLRAEGAPLVDLVNLDLSQNTALFFIQLAGSDVYELDLSNNSALTSIFLNGCSLSTLNVANGNNSNVPGGSFATLSNPDLFCVTVDDVGYSDSNWPNIDAQTSFSTDCSLNVQDYQLEQVHVFPNPVKSDLFVYVPEVSTYTIYNVLGQKISSGSLESGRNHIDVSDNSEQVLFLRIEANGYDKTFKVISGK